MQSEWKTMTGSGKKEKFQWCKLSRLNGGGMGYLRYCDGRPAY